MPYSSPFTVTMCVAISRLRRVSLGSHLIHSLSNYLDICTILICMQGYWSKLLSSPPSKTMKEKAGEDSEPCLPSTRDKGVRWRECSNVDDYMKRCGTLWAGTDERKSTDLLLSESLLDSVMAITCRYKQRGSKKLIFVRSTQFPPAH